LNCIYCQLGVTGRTTIRRGRFFDEDKILAQIEKAVSAPHEIDYITFSGSGEPTLNAALGSLIRRIKAFTDIPVAVLTNATLLTRPEVREALLAADLVVPSLDAATQEVFEEINRPHSSLQINDIIKSLKQFRREYSGRIWIEVMLVAGINDSPDHIRRLKAVIASLNPEKVQLNTVVRPPAEDLARPLDRKSLERIRRLLGDKAEIVADFARLPQPHAHRRVQDAILTLVSRRPATIEDLSHALGQHHDQIVKAAEHLVRQGKLRVRDHDRHKYYEIPE
jgi:wyosine [tRNA(Phe)-imidazoG37] synthetase (radical SAM superfamily)